MSHALNTVLVRDIIVEPKAGTSAKPTTLEAHHQAKMREFESAHGTLESLEMELNESEDRIAEMDDIGSDDWRILKDRIEVLRQEIAALKCDEGRLNYFLWVICYSNTMTHRSLWQMVARRPVSQPRFGCHQTRF